MCHPLRTSYLLFHLFDTSWRQLLACAKTWIKKQTFWFYLQFSLVVMKQVVGELQRVLTSGRNDWWAQAWFAVWIHGSHHMGMSCSAANMIYEKHIFFFYFTVIFRKANFCTSHITGKSKSDLLCEKEESVVGQTQECAAGQDYFQQMVQFPESDHLLLQIDVCAQVITLQMKK